MAGERNSYGPSGSIELAAETIFDKARLPDETAAPRSANWVCDVTGYRLYGLDGVDKVASGEWFEADDDQAAIETAKTMMDGKDCELWQGRRLVARIPSQHKAN